MISNKLLQVCKEQIYKPCSVLDNHLSRLTVANKLKRTTILDQSRANFVYHPFVLALDGVYIAYMSPYSWWALTSPFQPYQLLLAVYFLLHLPEDYSYLTLSSILALWCTDFPRTMPRLSDLLRTLFYSLLYICKIYIK